MKIKQIAILSLGAISLCYLAACSRQPATSILYYNQFAKGKAILGKGKFDIGPHEGLLAVRQYYFPCGSTLLPQKYYAAATAQAKYLKAHPQAILQLQGFDDAAGSPNYSLVTAQERADAVSGFLRLRNVNSMQLSTVSYGAETSGPYSGQSQAQNCRVDLVYIHE